MMNTLHVIDSHTGGEPTRTVVTGFPDLGGGTVRQQLDVLREKHDRYRSAVLLEPRGHDVLVGALLCPPADPGCTAGVLFFNNVGYLGMCGHGLIGVVKTLQHLGLASPGEHTIETPVGVVKAVLHSDGRVSVRNVPCHRLAKQVEIDVPELGTCRGDVAWGGNWFFLIEDHPFKLSVTQAGELIRVTNCIREAVNISGYPQVDHIELFGPPEDERNHSRNFVLCPGGQYDRSPCGTGTSAKLACLAADGKLAPGDSWRQESIVGSVFEGTYEPCDDGIVPTLSGQAFITAESHLVLDPQDPFCWGIGSLA